MTTVAEALAQAHRYRQAGRNDEAKDICRRILEIPVDRPESLHGHGGALELLGRLPEAVAVYRQVLALFPDQAVPWGRLGYTHFRLGQVEEAVESFGRALDLDPGLAEARSVHLFLLNHMPGLAAEAIHAAHRAFGRHHGVPPAGTILEPHTQSRDPERRLRVGYVSGDFCDHAVRFFLEPLLAAHDRAAVEVFAYAGAPRPDAVTRHLGSLVDHWFPIDGLDDKVLAGQVRRDGIDILVDLAGHTAHNRLSLFTRKPAPVQVTWLGYPDTTGLTAIDARLVDAITDPLGAEALASETLVRLPGGFLCYRPPAEAPAVAPLPAVGLGRITFGSFNRMLKVNAAVIAAWSAILHRVPGSRLVLKAFELVQPAVRQAIGAGFASHGIGGDRLVLLPPTRARDAHLGLYGGIDIALDPFPYNGTTTTCEALWMGVPVVARLGDRHAARVSASLLTRVGLDGLIAPDGAAYVETAVALARDGAGLAALRASLRARMSASTLCDSAGFARGVEAAYRALWRRWCAGLPPVARSQRTGMYP